MMTANETAENWIVGKLEWTEVEQEAWLEKEAKRIKELWKQSKNELGPQIGWEEETEVYAGKEQKMWAGQDVWVHMWKRVASMVEDEEQVRLVAKRILEKKAGYIVFEAGSYEETMEIFKAQKGNFEIVFSDTILPGKSGITLIEEIKKLNPKIKFLLSSGYNDDKVQNDLEESNKFNFIQKPYGVSELLDAIKNALNKEL